MLAVAAAQIPVALVVHMVEAGLDKAAALAALAVLVAGLAAVAVPVDTPVTEVVITMVVLAEVAVAPQAIILQHGELAAAAVLV
jgi:hypothetical protein